MHGVNRTPQRTGASSLYPSLSLGAAVPNAALVLSFAVFISLCGEAQGVPCRCYFGRAVATEPQCECTCDEGFMSPLCMFRAEEFPRLHVYLNRPIEQFVSIRLISAIERWVLADGTRMLGARNVSQFGKLEVLISMPGFAVNRFLHAVQYQDQWAVEAGILSAYVVEPRRPPGTYYDIILFENDAGVVIGLYGLLWLCLAALLIMAAVLLEGMCCFSNTEENVQDLALGSKYFDPMQAPQRLDGTA